MKIKLGNEEVFLDPDNLKFDETSINKFLQFYGSRYSYYVSKHADAQYLHRSYEDAYDALAANKFKEFKELGGSDKLCEAKATSDPEVQDALEKVRVSKYTVDMLWGYLRSMDKAHEDAMQLCYNLRKEMDKIFSTVKRSND